MAAKGDEVRLVQVTPVQVLMLQLAERAAATAGEAAGALYPGASGEQLRQVTRALMWWASEAAPRFAEHPDLTDEQVDAATDSAALELLRVVLGPPAAGALN